MSAPNRLHTPIPNPNILRPLPSIWPRLEHSGPVQLRHAPFPTSCHRKIDCIRNHCERNKHTLILLMAVNCPRRPLRESRAQHWSRRPETKKKKLDSELSRKRTQWPNRRSSFPPLLFSCLSIPKFHFIALIGPSPLGSVVLCIS